MTKKYYNNQGIIWIISGLIQTVVTTGFSEGKTIWIGIVLTLLSYVQSAFFFWKAYMIERSERRWKRVLGYTLEKKPYEKPDYNEMLNRNNKKDEEIA